MEILTTGRNGGSGSAASLRSFPAALVHSPWGLVAGLGDDRVLDRLALLVFHGQLLVGGGIHQLDLDLAEGAVARFVRRRIADHVLAAERLVDRLERKSTRLNSSHRCI